MCDKDRAGLHAPENLTGTGRKMRSEALTACAGKPAAARIGKQRLRVQPDMCGENLPHTGKERRSATGQGVARRI